MSPLSVLPLMLVLGQIAVVLSRPNAQNGYYCNIPCPFTNPCQPPEPQPDPLTVKVMMEQQCQPAGGYGGYNGCYGGYNGGNGGYNGGNGGYNGGYCPGNGDMTRSGTESQSPPSAPPASPASQASPPSPTDQKKRGSGLLGSLLKIPGAMADTLLSGEVTL